MAPHGKSGSALPPGVFSRRCFGLGLGSSLLSACARRHTGTQSDASSLPSEDAADGHTQGSRPRVDGGTTVAPGGSQLERILSVELGERLGAFDRLSGVQGSPHPLVAGDPDHTGDFLAARIARARFPQDCEPNTLTLGGIFPDERADPDRPESYRFEAIDRHVAASLSAKLEVLWQSSYDVGGSDAWVGLNLGGRAPRDVARWARVVTHCLEHFNVGWAGGFHRAVPFVEFVNEPNGLGGFHHTDLARLLPTFLEFLATVERYNERHPEAPVRAVGPGVPLSIAEWPAFRAPAQRLLGAVKASGRTLPVFSFHTYGENVSPLGNARLAEALRSALDEHGMGATELWNTEWQAGDFLRKHLSISERRAIEASPRERKVFAYAMATYAVSCKLRWQGLLRGSFYYRANRRAFPPGKQPPFASTGAAGYFLAPDNTAGPLGQHERLLERLSSVAPIRVATVLTQPPSSEPARDDGLIVAMGATNDRSSAASVVVANLRTTPIPVRIRVRGLASAHPPRAILRSLDADHAAGLESSAPVHITSDAIEIGCTVAALGTLGLELVGA